MISNVSDATVLLMTTEGFLEFCQEIGWDDPRNYEWEKHVREVRKERAGENRMVMVVAYRVAEGRHLYAYTTPIIS